MKTGNRFTAGLVAGMLLGVAAGFLLAPKKGKETRELVSDRTSRLRDQINRMRSCSQGEDASNHHIEAVS